MCVRRFVVMGFVMRVSSHWGQVALTADKCTIIPNICGDGIKNSSEICDDGNTVNGDGCSRSCQIEIGLMCSGRS